MVVGIIGVVLFLIVRRQCFGLGFVIWFFARVLIGWVFCGNGFGGDCIGSEVVGGFGGAEVRFVFVAVAGFEGPVSETRGGERF